mmetsp:Transcript_69098/g.165742  ORF Transcript_69098/g.165742 Transcript_69098/m.165742 type:complete len:919 (-) Transcript_69098:40-2796(-)
MVVESPSGRGRGQASGRGRGSGRGSGSGGRGYVASEAAEHRGDSGAKGRGKSSSFAKGGGKSGDKGKGKGKGRGQAYPGDNAAGTSRPSSQNTNPPGGASGAGASQPQKSSNSNSAPPAKPGLKASAEALRAFTEPQWWRIGEAERQAAPRAKVKPEAFRQDCVDKHAEMSTLYESTMMQDSEQRWLRRVCSEGTAGDKVASLTMLIQVSPVFSTKYIRALLAMAGRSGRSDSMMAVDALRDLLISTLLPDRKLKALEQMQPISPKGISGAAYNTICVIAYFEDFLKVSVATFVQVLNDAAHSTIDIFKTKAIKSCSEMLSHKPEQERALLSLVVNKLGDTKAKAASTASFCLRKLIEKHPPMKSIVATEVSGFLARANITEKARYFGILFLSEMEMRRGEHELAAQLMKIFVAQLESMLTAKRKPSKKADKKKNKKVRHEWGKKMRWNPNKPTWKSTDAKKGKLLDDDNKMVRTLINGIQRVFPYMEDSATSKSPLRVETIDTLFKVCHTISAYSTRVAILSLLYRFLFAKRNVTPDRFYRLVYDQIGQFDLFGCSHRMQSVVLMRKCVPADASIARGLALTRRLMQMGANTDPAVAIAGLSLMSELFVAHRIEMKPLINALDADVVKAEGGEEDEERFGDDDAEALNDQNDAKKPKDDETRNYDPLKREPKFARARNTPVWELCALARHIHPTVSGGAEKILRLEDFKDPSKNPFQEFAPQELLEQFAYSSSAKKKGRDGLLEKRRPVNSNTFIAKQKVPAHQRFFHLYFHDNIVEAARQRKEDQKRQEESDVDEEQDPEKEEEEADQFFDDYLQNDMPDVSEDDDDADLDDEDVDDDGDDDDDRDAEDDEDGGSMEGDGLEEAEAAQEEEAPAGKKRPLEEIMKLPGRKRAKELRAHTGGSVFASAEDFEQFLDV